MQDNELSDEDIALMCDIAGSSVVKTDAHRDAEIGRLRSAGFIEILPADDSGQERFKITAKGQKHLDNRGVGANEA